MDIGLGVRIIPWREVPADAAKRFHFPTPSCFSSPRSGSALDRTVEPLRIFPTQFQRENRYALFPGIALLFLRNSGRKTASHFSWNCSSVPTQFRTENRFALFLELLFCSYAIPDGKPLRTFPGIALLFLRNSGRKTASHFSWNCSSV
ncbi:MAG: hypothetical protein E5W25_27950, partial [Mesorhizobium sp.]